MYDEYRAFSNVYFGVKRCSFDLKQTLKEKNLLSDYGMFSTNVYGNYPLNVTNIYTAYYLQKIGYLGITLSVELTDYEIKQFFYLYQTVFHNSFPFEVFSYGRVENMIIKGNILSLKKGNYYLEDDKKRCFPVYYDGTLTHILNYEIWDRNESYDYNNIYYRLDFFEESASETQQILTRFSSKKFIHK